MFGEFLMRRGLKNPATAFVYQKLVNILQRITVWHDVLAMRCANTAIPDISILRQPSSAVSVERAAVFAIYAGTLDANHQRTMRALSQAGYCVILINNQAFDDVTGVPPEAAFIIENHNVGRDIGAYIRALRVIRAHGGLTSQARVLFLNDSVIYLPGAQASFATMATAQEDWIGIASDDQGSFHLSSWCFQLSAAVVNSAAFHRWAAQLAPLTNRVYLIRAGEIRLSRILFAAGLQPRVLFDRSFWLSLCDRIRASDNVVAGILPRNLMELYPKGRDNNRFLSLANQTHLFTFPGIAFGVFPFLKKDLYHRRVFSLEHIELLCAEIAARYGHPLAAECRHILFGRGQVSRGRSGLRRWLGVD